MDNPKEPPASEARRTLKLKVRPSKEKPAAPRAYAATAAPTSRPAPAAAQGRDPGAWADVYKKKMQADMDALVSGEDSNTRGSPRR